eukprot:CAMPEP_0170412924 /NCGR_PEP_ID=MMETSP0117_2-20130122/31239_1 /TAXON_ID=400756 /ORGANISM="Durinskia baltica, Strain CSIRO CS-38" /LENGTH=42 /DNA_ID= /DNA_START= /DNA_END= /DNA_ORIENTATION=
MAAPLENTAKRDWRPTVSYSDDNRRMAGGVLGAPTCDVLSLG